MSPAPVGVQDSELDVAIAVLRGRIDEEFRLTERWDAKARQTFALAAGFFVVVQVAAFGSFAATSIDNTERVVMAVSALVAALGLVIAAAFQAKCEEPLREHDLQPEAIETWFNDPDPQLQQVSARLVGELILTARRRTDNNAIRFDRYSRLVTTARWAMTTAGLELIIALAVRIDL